MTINTPEWNTLQDPGKKGRVVHELWHLAQFCFMLEDRFDQGATTDNVAYTLISSG